MDKKTILVVGSGIAGLSAAQELTCLGFSVILVESAPFLGGHAIQLSCKAIDKCVKCGACLLEDRLKTVLDNPKIHILKNSQIKSVSKTDSFTVTIHTRPAYINPEACSRCGICAEECPVEGAITRGFSQHHLPFYALRDEVCLHFKDKSCSLCQEKCPEKAILLDQAVLTSSFAIDAIILATGFQAFNPQNKPYGYRIFENVITNLELEQMLRRQYRLIRPSDGQTPDKIAFIQCVGSRDAGRNHLWCSRVCCASALRLARSIKMKHPETGITLFYLDIQTFGKGFQKFYEKARNEIRMIRSIPGDIFKTENDRLEVNFFDPENNAGNQELFDMVILSVGLTPRKDTEQLTDLLAIKPVHTGYSCNNSLNKHALRDGVFVAGTAHAPMSITESIDHAVHAAYRATKFLGREAD